APRNIKAENQTYSRAFVGYKGSSVTYRIHGGMRGEALFEDSDVGDVLTIDVDNNNVNNNWYREALKLALEQDDKLDWNVNAATGKERAITVSVEGEYVTITINRRMDKVLPDGSYAAEVTFPLVLTCTDRGGKQDSATIQITVCNTPLTSSQVIEGEHIDARTGVGYTFERNTSSPYDNEYILNASVMKGTDLTVNLTDILEDVDYKLGGNTDSYKFVKGGEGDAHQSNFPYLLDAPEKAIYYTDIEYGEHRDLATVTPIYTKYLTDLNYTGFTINAESSVRNSTGSLRLHIVDRAGDVDSDSEGIYITLRITVINTPPEVIEGMDGYTIDILGSDTATTGKTFPIKDFVRDRNESDVADMESASQDEKGTETWLRIYTITYSYYTEI
ncbi:MAG: hypothetical protein K2M48_02335, partial [Clostridiales bacterium]|nr:hypothetical protein [Clostridiales bacterium]